MSDRENCFSTAIRLLARHDACNDQVTGETLLSLLRLLERNEIQHTQDYAALDALTRKLTSLVAHIAEHTIAQDDDAVRSVPARLERQLDAPSQAAARVQRSDDEPLSLIGRDARAARSDQSMAPRRAVGGRATPIVVEDADAQRPVKRSFVDVVADISRRREAHASGSFDAPTAYLDAVRNEADEYDIQAREEQVALASHDYDDDRRKTAETTAVEEGDDEDLVIQQMLGQLDRITTELERSERVLSALPELVDTVGELVAEIDKSEHDSDGSPAAHTGRQQTEHQLARHAPRDADDAAPVLAASDRANKEALPSESSTQATEERPRGPVRAMSVTAGSKASAGVSRSQRAVRPVSRREVGGAQPRRILTRVNDKPANRRWRPFAGACALFVAANVAMALEVANSRVDPVQVVGEAQAAVPTFVATSNATRVPASDLLSHEQITRSPAALVMPTLIAQHEAAGALGSAGPATAVSSRAIADYQLAMRYVEGRFSPQNMSEAACLFERAAVGGLAPAQYRLALLLERGLGTPKNLERAKAFYRRAAEAGHVRAMHNLGVLLSQSSAPNAYKDAAVWFEQAAQYGVADSQYNLAVLFSRGLGVPRSASQAYRWFGIAAKQGDPGAQRERDAIGATLSAADLAAAKVQIAAFVARPSTPGANAVPSEFEEGGASGARLRKIGLSIAEPCIAGSATSLRVSMK